MNDRELVSMAVFRLYESAKRLQVLIEHTESPALKLWLASLARRLGEQADRAALISAAAKDDPDSDNADRSEGHARRSPLPQGEGEGEGI